MLLRNSGKVTLDSRKEDSRSSVPVLPERTLWCHCYHHCPEDSVNNTCRLDPHLSVSQYSSVTVAACRCRVRSISHCSLFYFILFIYIINVKMDQGLVIVYSLNRNLIIGNTRFIRFKIFSLIFHPRPSAFHSLHTLNLIRFYRHSRSCTADFSSSDRLWRFWYRRWWWWFKWCCCLQNWWLLLHHGGGGRGRAPDAHLRLFGIGGLWISVQGEEDA